MSFDFRDKEAWYRVSALVIGLMVVIGVTEPEFAEQIGATVETVITAVFVIVGSIAALVKRGE